MKRLIIIVDAVRYDVARGYLYPALKGHLHRVPGIADKTEDFYRIVKPWIEGFPGRKILFTCGWGTLAKVKADAGPFNMMFPLKNGYREITRQLTRSAREPKGSLVIVHDFYVHNYFEDIGGLGELKVEKFDEIWRVYVERIKSIIGPIRLVIKEAQSLGFDIFLTADHGEAFWEEGSKQFHHGESCRDESGIPAQVVMDNFILHLNGQHLVLGKTKITQEKLFKGEPL